MPLLGGGLPYLSDKSAGNLRASSFWRNQEERKGQAAERSLSHGCVGPFQSAEWALVKWLTGTAGMVDQALNDHQSRK